MSATPGSLGVLKGLFDLLERDRNILSVTAETPAGIGRVTAKPAPLLACTPVTPVTPHIGVTELATSSWLDPNRYCWPNSDAMNTAELATFERRISLFMRRGKTTVQAESLADELVLRDRDGDDRRLCVECGHGQSRRCPGGAPLRISSHCWAFEGYAGDAGAEAQP